MHPDNDPVKDELSLRDYLAPLRKRFALLVLPMLILPVIVELNRRSQQTEYRARAVVLVAESHASLAINGTRPNSVGQVRDLVAEVELAQSDEVRMRVEDQLGPISRDELGTISTEENEVDRIVFRARASSRRNAAELVNTWADQYLEVRRSQATATIAEATDRMRVALDAAVVERSSISENLDGLEYRFTRSEDQAEQLEIQRQIQLERAVVGDELLPIDALIEVYAENIQELAVASNLAQVAGPTIIGRAAPGDAESTTSSQIVLAIFAVIVGGLVGFGAVMLREITDSKISGVADFSARNLPLEVLAAIPTPAKLGRIESIDEGLVEFRNASSDSFDRLRSAVDFLATESGIKSLAIVDSTGQKAKTWTAIGLGLAYAAAGRNVLLVDADSQESRLTAWLDTSRSNQQNGQPNGLVELEHPSGPLTSGSLRVAPAGVAAAEYGPADRRQAASPWTVGEIIIYDAPPVLTGFGAGMLASQVDAVLLVASVGITERDDTRRTALELTRAGGRLLGVALIGAGAKSGRTTAV